jgi:hypothetical protein
LNAPAIVDIRDDRFNVRCVCVLSNATSARSMIDRSIWFAVSSALHHLG